jgi:outer membrane receptor protein involved in Fe transport
MDLLRHVPGMTLIDTATGSYYIGFRGTTPAPKGTMIMLDGIEINTAANYILAQNIPIANVERIEVIKNPASALYGPAGVGGVIHIITKPASKPFESKINLSYGSFKRQESIIHCHGFLDNGFSYGLLGTLFNTDGYRDESKTSYQIISPRMGFETDRLHAEFIGIMKPSKGYQPGGLPLDQYKENPKQATSPDSTGKGYATTWGAKLNFLINPSSRLILKSSYRTDDWHAEMDGNYLEGDDQWHWTGEANYQKIYKTDCIKNTFLAGFEYRKYHSTYRMHPDDYWADKTWWWESSNIIDENIMGVFIQNDLKFAETITINLGGRYDRIHLKYTDKQYAVNNVNQTHKKICPRIGFSYFPKQSFSIFGNYSQGIRSVNLVETVYRPKDHLEPEKLNSYELGLRGHFSDNMKITIASFLTQTSDYIIETGIGQTLNWENAGKVESKGIECSISKFFPNGVYASLDYTYQLSEYKQYKTLRNDYSGKTVPLIPENIIGSTLGMKTNYYGSFNFSIRYIDDKYLDHDNKLILPDAIVADFKYTFYLHLIELTLSAKNIFNTTYAEYGKINGGSYVNWVPVAYPANGREVIACAQWTF